MYAFNWIPPIKKTAPPSQAKALEDFAARNTICSTLDPLLSVLSRDYVDDNDLTSRLEKLFKARDKQDGLILVQSVVCAWKLTGSIIFDRDFGI